MAREPAAAGTFYEDDVDGLRQSIEECFLGALGPGALPGLTRERRGKIVGLVCPHAGYVYSGQAAAHAYAALASNGLPETIVLLGPNHHGLGPAVAVSPDEEWITPLGSVRTDARTANVIVEHCRFARMNDAAHLREHSIEVQLPFLQYIGGDDVGIVPIVIAHLGAEEAVMLAGELGAAIAEALAGKSAVVIASTDFTHYETQSSAAEKDSAAMSHILALDAAGLVGEVYGRSITMCGVVGTAVMIEACKALGATQARKLAYYSSGDVTGDMTHVVGYGAVAVEC